MYIHWFSLDFHFIIEQTLVHIQFDRIPYLRCSSMQILSLYRYNKIQYAVLSYVEGIKKKR